MERYARYYYPRGLLWYDSDTGVFPEPKTIEGQYRVIEFCRFALGDLLLLSRKP